MGSPDATNSARQELYLRALLLELGEGHPCEVEGSRILQGIGLRFRSIRRIAWRRFLWRIRIYAEHPEDTWLAGQVEGGYAEGRADLEHAQPGREASYKQRQDDRIDVSQRPGI